MPARLNLPGNHALPSDDLELCFNSVLGTGVHEQHSQATWQANGSSTSFLRKKQKDRSLMPLRIVNFQNIGAKPSGFEVRTLIHRIMTTERSHSAITPFSDENLSLHRVYIH